MSFIGNLISEMERSTAGSEDTANRVMELCGAVKCRNALFFGDETYTPRVIAQRTGVTPLAAFYEPHRAERAAMLGLETRVVGLYELPETEGGWDFVWLNGGTEPDGVPARLERLRGCMKKGAVAVYRTLCWLIDPSPDTRGFVERRFGRPVPLDAVVRFARECGFKVRDFYIAPKTDWTNGFYRPLSGLIQKYEGLSDGEASAGVGEINKEMYMFDLHSEEYSYVYYILEK
ncbi:MAG: hypothetical protein NC299_00370 [Lachnospiraceae bacterium]|nr:hypothetical protein [Ruminococcus sp.]MCM1273800.1 hypothetical protein [Lachnospiraceae bacterium]